MALSIVGCDAVAQKNEVVMKLISSSLIKKPIDGYCVMKKLGDKPVLCSIFTSNDSIVLTSLDSLKSSFLTFPKGSLKIINSDDFSLVDSVLWFYSEEQSKVLKISASSPEEQTFPFPDSLAIWGKPLLFESFIFGHVLFKENVLDIGTHYEYVRHANMFRYNCEDGKLVLFGSYPENYKRNFFADYWGELTWAGQKPPLLISSYSFSDSVETYSLSDLSRKVLWMGSSESSIQNIPDEYFDNYHRENQHFMSSGNYDMLSYNALTNEFLRVYYTGIQDLSVDYLPERQTVVRNLLIFDGDFQFKYEFKFPNQRFDYFQLEYYGNKVYALRKDSNNDFMVDIFLLEFDN
ncbi:MAG TPA: hypothetical protein VFV37_09625 [Luteibaculaceae bacterium]|nr:hypothetical protein [Luteibaculaceae bacterium]